MHMNKTLPRNSSNLNSLFDRPKRCSFVLKNTFLKGRYSHFNWILCLMYRKRSYFVYLPPNESSLDWLAELGRWWLSHSWRISEIKQLDYFEFGMATSKIKLFSKIYFGGIVGIYQFIKNLKHDVKIIEFGKGS